jgi:Ca2+-binding RTX toxin-like protein
LLSNGQFLVAGTADTRNEDFALTRLNADGSKDATFGNAGQTFTDFGSSTWDRGWAIAKTSDGRIIVGGSSDRKFALVAYRGAVPSNVLRIDGTTANDTISVGQSGTTLSISVNGAVRTASTAGLSKIYLYGLDGDDTLSVAKSVTIDAVLVGGRGFDRLHAGSGRDQLFGGDGTDAADYSDVTVANYVSLDNVANDGPARNQNVHSDVEIVLGGSGADTLIGSNNYNVLVGNGGNDILTGNAGRDVLIGGAGKDTLSGGADVDLLIASRTTFDASLPTLRTLSFEWREPTRSYATRIVRLRAGVLGAKIDATTIPNDSIADTLTGGSGQDWFVKHSGDVLSDKAAEETATQF